MKKPRKQKEPIKASNVFCCETCESKPVLESPYDVQKHLKEVHGLTEFKGKRQMLMHLDCEDSFHSTYEWEIGSVKLTQSTTTPRAKDDPMRFCH